MEYRRDMIKRWGRLTPPGNRPGAVTKRLLPAIAFEKHETPF
jgi:hypothetical protein